MAYAVVQPRDYCIYVYYSSFSVINAFHSADDGRLHKAVNVNKKVHVIEEIQLFPSKDPVQELLIDHSKVRMQRDIAIGYRSITW